MKDIESLISISEKFNLDIAKLTSLESKMIRKITAIYILFRDSRRHCQDRGQKCFAAKVDAS